MYLQLTCKHILKIADLIYYRIAVHFIVQGSYQSVLFKLNICYITNKKHSSL
jgi:hypothetical protein